MTNIQRAFVAVGYPKVGNTWLRLTLGRYLQERYGLTEMPVIDAAEWPLLAERGVRAIGDFTHSPLTWATQTAADLTRDNVVAPFTRQRVVLLVRHPLDALVSLYMHKRFQKSDSPYQGSFEAFVQDPVFSVQKMIRFYTLWAEGQDEAGAMCLWRYEDARARPIDEFTRVLAFLGEPIDSGAVRRAVDFASFENTSALELSERPPVYKSSGFPVFSTGDRENPNARHVRKGTVGGYREEIPSPLVDELELQVRYGMPKLYGYDHAL